MSLEKDRFRERERHRTYPSLSSKFAVPLNVSKYEEERDGQDTDDENHPA